MSDNIPVTPGAGVTVATRDVGSGVEAQRVIVNYWSGGAGPGTATDVGLATPLPVIYPVTWSAVHTPATATQATATKIAGSAGVKHVATYLTYVYSAGASAIAAAAPLLINLRDGSTGAGTILWSAYVNIPAVAGQTTHGEVGPLAIVGSAATALTLEFSAAGGTNSYQSVTLLGYDTTN